jgi:ABC-type lipoprotein release transport system permease subunit
MRSLLFQVPPLNVAVLAAAACVTSAVCLAACLLPSQRAAGISPMETLAEE